MRLHPLPLFLALSCAGSHRTVTCPLPVLVSPPLAVMGPLELTAPVTAATTPPVDATVATPRPTRSRVPLSVLCQRMDAGIEPPQEVVEEEINPDEVVPLINHAMAVVDRVLDGGPMDGSRVRQQMLLAPPTSGDQTTMMSGSGDAAGPAVDASVQDAHTPSTVADASAPVDGGRPRHRHRRH